MGSVNMSHTLGKLGLTLHQTTKCFTKPKLKGPADDKINVAKIW